MTEVIVAPTRLRVEGQAGSKAGALLLQPPRRQQRALRVRHEQRAARMPLDLFTAVESQAVHGPLNGGQLHTGPMRASDAGRARTLE